jgi:hypothetical protein
MVGATLVEGVGEVGGGLKDTVLKTVMPDA